MATLTSVPVFLPEDKVPSKRMVRDIIGTFLTSEWPTVDPETLTIQYHASFANAHCPVERPQPTNGAPLEPLKVFIKFHNESGSDFEVFRHLAPSKADEATLCDEYGRSGLGAKMYGFFKTNDGTLGRVDEFLDARTLEPEDVEDEAIRADVAKGLAAFHSLHNTSLRKKSVQAYYEAVTSGLAKYHQNEKLKTLGREGRVNVDKLIDYNFATRLRKVVGKLESIGAKTGSCIHDVQFMNVLVMNDPKEGASRIVLIDFEFVMHNYRAFDIGGHYMQKLFKWFDDDNKIADCRPYAEHEKRHFCREYAEKWNELTGDSDTGEQVYLEAEYGYMLAITFDIHNMLCFMDEQGDKDPLNLMGLNKLFDEFVDQYKKLGLEDSE
ncbi:Choline kinase [Purpureocillium takamizusanense]|uniref:Choline kinase n=1 Tax=Purpureocillium takamizusanense TaxID=2060973 RepID=A0A9Q8QS53_9HYPO|nr:Choline kinase [Purpureocillium takamizusanense]UNI24895.1 Choline kinase [Purpureocillium takamizusanense]